MHRAGHFPYGAVKCYVHVFNLLFLIAGCWFLVSGFLQMARRFVGLIESTTARITGGLSLPARSGERQGQIGALYVELATGYQVRRGRIWQESTQQFTS
jgi:hypothetical protein